MLTRGGETRWLKARRRRAPTWRRRARRRRPAWRRSRTTPCSATSSGSLPSWSARASTWSARTPRPASGWPSRPPSSTSPPRSSPRSWAAGRSTAPAAPPATLSPASLAAMRYLVRERLFSISDDFWVTDERGDKIFLVDGKALRLRETFELKDASGAIVATIRKRFLRFTDTLDIEHHGE